MTVTTYDAALRIKETATRKSGTDLEKTVLTFDPNGNRLTQTRTVAASGSIQAEAENTRYTYDTDDRLTETQTTRTQGSTTTSQTVAYTLDAHGNRTREASTSSTASLAYTKDFNFDPRDRITRIDTTGTGTGINAAGTTNYDYDPNGNLIKRTRGATQRLFVWNARDRLTSVTEASLVLGSYRYNPDGHRDEILTGPGARRTTWVDGFAYLDKTPSNTLLAKYETHPNGRSPVMVATPGGTDWLHGDALGSTTLATANDGNSKAATRFDAFGNSEQQGFSPNKFGYTGHETDSDTGLVYFKARHYDPELGRFISADPYEGESNSPVTWNSYLYANSNPLVYIDKDGYAAVIPDDPDTPSDLPKKPGPVEAASNYLKDRAIEFGAKGGKAREVAGASAYGALDTFFPGSEAEVIPAGKIIGKIVTKAKQIGEAIGDAIKSSKKGDGVLTKEGRDVVTEGKKLDPSGEGKEPKIEKREKPKTPDSEGNQPSGDPKKRPVRKNEVTTYEDFTDRSVVGDKLEGHEVLQHAYLKSKGHATTRRSTEASKKNPVIALEQETHKEVNKAQKSLDVANQSARENIESNARILREQGVPDKDVNRAVKKAVKHAQDIGEMKK